MTNEKPFKSTEERVAEYTRYFSTYGAPVPSQAPKPRTSANFEKFSLYSGGRCGYARSTSECR